MIENLLRNRPEWRDRDLNALCSDWLHRVGFGDPESVLRRYPGELSGGMSQRAMIALILSTEPSLLLADEPTSALDATVQLEVLELMAKLNRERGVAVLLVTHDIGVALRYASRIVVAAQGRVVDEGTREHFNNAASELSSEATALLAGERALRSGTNPARDA
jgi:ABC-type dipeptide/oligopeptide/nickel transport system ATPase component